MNYTNEHGVRFKINIERTNWYRTKYYSDRTNRPRRYFTFHCEYETQMRQMFFILSTVRMCPDCHHEAFRLGDCCPECKFRRIANLPPPPLEYCNVCYLAVFEADNSRLQLTCKCVICPQCSNNMNYMDWVENQMAIDCPSCHIKTLL